MATNSPEEHGQALHKERNCSMPSTEL
jgi:predicted Zn-dependent peptidase